MYKLSELNPNWKKAGIYKINFPNGKCYIGLSNNIRRRMLEHNRRYISEKYPLYKAIKKYGAIEKFEILEEIDPDNTELLAEREIYWIEYYNSTDRDKGYNISSGGDCYHLVGQNHPNAKLNNEQVMEIINLLKNTQLTIIDISKRFNINKGTISDINMGKSYKQKDIKYPVRTKEEILFIQNNLNKILDDKKVHEIISDLKNTELTFSELASKFSVCATTIERINFGLGYNYKEINYPIRNKEKIKEISNKKVSKSKSKYTLEDVLKTINMLENTNLSNRQIAKELEYSRSFVDNVNNGVHKLSPKDLLYPIKSKKKG